MKRKLNELNATMKKFERGCPYCFLVSADKDEGWHDPKRCPNLTPWKDNEPATHSGNENKFQRWSMGNAPPPNEGICYGCFLPDQKGEFHSFQVASDVVGKGPFPRCKYLHVLPRMLYASTVQESLQQQFSKFMRIDGGWKSDSEFMQWLMQPYEGQRGYTNIRYFAEWASQKMMERDTMSSDSE